MTKQTETKGSEKNLKTNETLAMSERSCLIPLKVLQHVNTEISFDQYILDRTVPTLLW